MLYGKCFTCVSYYYFIPSLLFSNYQHTLHLVTLGCWQLPILLRKKTKTKGEHPGAPNTIPFSFSPIMTDKLFVVLLSQPSHFALDFIFSPMQEYRSSNSPVSCITNFSLYWVILLRKQPWCDYYYFKTKPENCLPSRLAPTQKTSKTKTSPDLTSSLLVSLYVFSFPCRVNLKRAGTDIILYLSPLESYCQIAY